jgi:hypothetical protein
VLSCAFKKSLQEKTLNRFRNSVLAALGIAALIVVLAANTRITHASGGPVVVQVFGTASTQDVNNPDLQPVQFNLLPHSLTSNQNAAFFTVPAGKRLVIDYYSSQAQDLSGGAAAMTLGTTAGGVFGSYIVYTNKNDTNEVNQTCHIVADPGTAVEAFAFNSGATCGGLINISGHYVNVP